MIQYNKTKPKVYIETTVVSYLVARPSHDVTLLARQQATQQLWTEYADNFEFIISNVVVSEAREGNPIAAQRRLEINEVCHAAGFQPTTLCTPTELIEEIQMKEKPDTRLDPVLEECYRMKEAFAARFRSAQELNDYLLAETEKNKALGWKYLSPPQPQTERNQKARKTPEKNSTA